MPHTLTWQEQGQTRQAPWRNTAAQKPPAAIAVAEAGLSAKAALKSFRQGQALLWRGDYHQAVQLLSAVKRQRSRLCKVKSKHASLPPLSASPLG